MKKVLAILFSIGTLSVAAQNRSINFEHGTWAEITAKAKKENKLIFLDAFTSWCGPCKWMAKNTFTNDTTADFYNSNFVNAKIDMEKGEGMQIAEKYQVQAYPSLLYINGDGKVMHRTCGAIPSKDFVELGKLALDPNKRFAAYSDKYDAGNREPAFVISYLDMLDASALNTGKVADEYLNAQKESELANRGNWTILKNYSRSTNSKSFKYLETHLNDFYAKYTQDSVDAVIVNNYSGVLYTAVREKNDVAFHKTKNMLVKANYKNADKMISSIEMEKFAHEEKWNDYANTAINHMEKFVDKNDYGMMNNLAWQFYENVTDKTQLAMAEAWAKTAAEGENAYASYDTYAAVQYKAGKLKEAEATANKAIELGKKEGADVSGTQELLEKIKGKK